MTSTGGRSCCGGGRGSRRRDRQGGGGSGCGHHGGSGGGAGSRRRRQQQRQRGRRAESGRRWWCSQRRGSQRCGSWSMSWRRQRAALLPKTSTGSLLRCFHASIFTTLEDISCHPSSCLLSSCHRSCGSGSKRDNHGASGRRQGHWQRRGKGQRQRRSSGAIGRGAAGCRV